MRGKIILNIGINGGQNNSELEVKSDVISFSTEVKVVVEFEAKSEAIVTEFDVKSEAVISACTVAFSGLESSSFDSSIAFSGVVSLSNLMTGVSEAESTWPAEGVISTMGARTMVEFETCTVVEAGPSIAEFDACTMAETGVKFFSSRIRRLRVYAGDVGDEVGDAFGGDDAFDGLTSRTAFLGGY